VSRPRRPFTAEYEQELEDLDEAYERKLAADMEWLAGDEEDGE
jgi:hypothetical protein